VPITWCLLDGLQLLPSWLPGARALLGGFMYFLVAGVIALAVWVRKGMIHPTYIRMAPGVIQVLECRFRKPRPAIRSYPMEPSTLMLLTRIRKKLILTLSRGDHQDVFSFSEMQQPAQRIERTWQTLLSTAPTPPPSRNELLG
jgi:hypothetical protein